MSYWTVTGATIKEDGRLLEVSFKDSNSIESMTLQLGAEEWRNIIFYKGERTELNRRLDRAMAQLARHTAKAAYDIYCEANTEREGD